MSKKSRNSGVGKNKLYLTHQVELLREEARRYYSHLNKIETNYSWSSFSGEIDEHIRELSDEQRELIPEQHQDIEGINIDEERLRQFALGVPKSEGKKHFPKMEDIKLLALDLFLTDPENPYSRLSREKLHGGDWLNAASILVRYFQFENNEETNFSKENLCGCFIFNSDVAPVKLIIEPEPRATNVFRATIEMIWERSGSLRTGWAIASPEDHLVILVKSDSIHQNFIYLTLAVDDNLYNGTPVNSIALIESSLLSTFNDFAAHSKKELIDANGGQINKILILKRES
jgi:hypothetical protein